MDERKQMILNETKGIWMKRKVDECNRQMEGMKQKMD